ncbi:hypothetical protein JB92DRAFT_2973426, partial [Gautieria morchelliformis]
MLLSPCPSLLLRPSLLLPLCPCPLLPLPLAPCPPLPPPLPPCPSLPLPLPPCSSLPLPLSPCPSLLLARFPCLHCCVLYPSGTCGQTSSCASCRTSQGGSTPASSC